jgi:hypothetical protein
MVPNQCLYMHQHAVRTAATLYSEGTLTLTEAATQAGVTPAGLQRFVARFGLAAAPQSTETRKRVHVTAD